MFYDFAITVEKLSTKTSPSEQRLKLTHGVIHAIRLDFPPGPRGEVNLAIYHEEHQLYPTNPGGAFNADNTYITYDDYFELLTAPYELVARGWAPTADYDHTIHIEIGLLESKLALVSLRIAGGIEKLLRFLGIGV